MSDIDPSEAGVGRRANPEREGLPPTYRMRADAHYVEQLATRRERADRLDAPRPSAGNGDVPDRETPVERRDRRSDRVMAQLGEEISAILSAATMLSADGSALAQRVSADMIRAQAWRASWLLKASALVDGRHRGQTRPKAIGPLLEQIRQGLMPECRLAGATLRVHATDWETPVAVDEAALSAAITGAVFATLTIAGTEDVNIRVTVDTAGGEVRQVEISQDDAAVPSAASLRFFDPTWADRPGGWSAGLAALTVRSAAQQLGGSATLVPGDRRGTTIRLNLSRI